MGRASQERKLENHGFNAAGERVPQILSNVSNQNDASGGAITPLNITSNFTADAGTVLWYNARGLPPGLEMGPPLTGIISGTPTTPGTYAASVTAISSVGTSIPNSFTWTIT